MIEETSVFPLFSATRPTKRGEGILGEDAARRWREVHTHLFEMFVVPGGFLFWLPPKNEASTTGPVTPGGLCAPEDDDVSSRVVPAGTAAAAAAAAFAELDWFFEGEGATESTCCCCCWMLL